MPLLGRQGSGQEDNQQVQPCPAGPYETSAALHGHVEPRRGQETQVPG